MLQCLNCANDNYARRTQARGAALDVKEFFGTKVSPKPSFCDHIPSFANKLHRCLRGKIRIAAMSNISKWPSMYHHYIIFKRLHNVWLQRILQQSRHGAMRIEVFGIDGFPVLHLSVRVSNDDAP